MSAPPPRSVRLADLALREADVAHDVSKVGTTELARQRLLVEVDQPAERYALLGSDDGVACVWWWRWW